MDWNTNKSRIDEQLKGESKKKKMWHDSNKLKIARPIDQADDITRLQLFFFFDESINRRQCELLSKPSERRVFFFYFFNDPFVVCSGCSIPAEFFFSLPHSVPHRGLNGLEHANGDAIPGRHELRHSTEISNFCAPFCLLGRDWIDDNVRVLSILLRP